MSEDKAPYGNNPQILGECLCDNYSELKSVAEEMAAALQALLKNRTYKPAQSALEKFNKLKEK